MAEEFYCLNLLFKIAWDLLNAEVPETKYKPEEKLDIEDIDSIVYIHLSIH